MSTNKMKGLLKGLRYISQIFDNEKEPEMQIGYPTDVKHVAHIGWDGPSMNEFKGGSECGSGPLNGVGDTEDRGNRRAPASPARDLPDLPRSSRRSTGAGGESPPREKSERERTRPSRKSSKNSLKESDSSKGTRVPDPSSLTGCESPSRNLPDVPKKSRRKKSKDTRDPSLAGGGGGGGSTKSRSKAPAPEPASWAVSFSDPGSGSGSGNVSRFKKDKSVKKSFEGGDGFS